MALCTDPAVPSRSWALGQLVEVAFTPGCWYPATLTGIPVRGDVAMTGEITLRGEVTAIGGLKEKLLAALRGGIKTVLIPEENVKDLAEIADEIKNRLDIRPVRWIEHVLEAELRPMNATVPDPSAGLKLSPEMVSDAPPVDAALTGAPDETTGTSKAKLLAWSVPTTPLTVTATIAGFGI